METVGLRASPGLVAPELRQPARADGPELEGASRLTAAHHPAHDEDEGETNNGTTDRKQKCGCHRVTGWRNPDAAKRKYGRELVRIQAQRLTPPLFCRMLLA